MSITDNQIEGEIEGRIAFAIHFEMERPTRAHIYSQDGEFWFRPAFCEARAITPDQYQELKGGIETGKFNTDLFLVSDLSYDEFMNKYYNS